MAGLIPTSGAASLILALLVATAASWALPHHRPLVYYQQQQQQQLEHQQQQQQQQQQDNVFYRSQQPGSFYYAPTDSVANVPNVVPQTYAAVPVQSDASHYVIVYPPAGGVYSQASGVYPQVGGVFPQQPPVFRQHSVALGQGVPPAVYRDEENVGEAPEVPPARPGWWATIVNIFVPSSTGTTTTPAPVVAEVEETTTPAPSNSVDTDSKPEKVVNEIMMAVEQSFPSNTGEKSGALETLDEEAVEGGDDEQHHQQEEGGDTLVRSDGGGGGHKYLAVQNPQFYGNYGNLQHLAAQGGPVATFLQRRNPEEPQVAQYPLYPAPQFQYQPLPFPKLLPYAPAPAPAQAPGVAALEFQRTLQAAKLVGQHNAVVPVFAGQRSATIPGSKHVDVSQNLEKFLAQAHQNQIKAQQEALPGSLQSNIDALFPQIPDLQALQKAQNNPGLINVGPGYQNVYYVVSKQTTEDSQAIAVDAQKGNKVNASDKVEAIEEQAGPSVAQAKPQAIALAGPGGTAAATPIATALVGPGGLAVSAPTATAVAGQTGGGSLVGPAAAAVNKYLTLMGGVKKTSDEYGQGYAGYGAPV